MVKVGQERSYLEGSVRPGSALPRKHQLFDPRCAGGKILMEVKVPINAQLMRKLVLIKGN